MALPPQPNNQPYYRSDSGDSAACMMGPAAGHQDEAGCGRRRRPCSPVWLAMAVMAILALQIACTTGLFVYFTMSIAKLKAQTQGSSEELKCLQLIHRLQEVPDLEELMGNQSCLKLASSLKSYVNMVTENVIRRSPLKDAMRSDFNTSTGHLATGALGRASAHLSLRQQSPSQDGTRTEHKPAEPRQPHGGISSRAVPAGIRTMPSTRSSPEVSYPPQAGLSVEVTAWPGVQILVLSPCWELS